MCSGVGAAFFVRALWFGSQLQRFALVLLAAQEPAREVAGGDARCVQQAAVPVVAKDEDAIAGAPRRGPAALVPGGRTDKIKFVQAALRRLVQDFMYQKLARAVAAIRFVIAGLGQEVTAAEVEGKMASDGLAVQL